jgi:hypothetical protein
MPKTKNDIINAALRRIAVVASDEVSTADQRSYSSDTLDGLFAELTGVEGMTFDWGLSAVPDEMFLPLSYLLAVEVAPHFLVNAPDTRSRAMHRVRAVAFPNDADDRRDVDDDGAVTEAEALDGQRAAYF